jgi:transcriptional regulator with XRE-family HTH domain
MLGARIKKYLDDNGIKQTFLAQRIGTFDSTMSDILNGKRNITAEEYYLICKALNVPMEKFVEEDLAAEG